jgi:nitroreductase
MHDILKVVQERQSARGFYDSTHPVAKEDLRQILEAARWTPTAHNMQNFEIIVVDDMKIIEDIGNIKYPISSTFIRENYEQLSFSEEELRKKKVGLLAASFPPPWRTPEAQRGEISGEQENPFIGQAIKSSPVLLVLLYDPDRRAPASEGDFLGIVSLGCALENMWLTASSLGIAFHVVSALGGNQAEKEVKRILNVPTPLKIVFACRLGYPAAPSPHGIRVRRDIEDFTSHDRYRNRENI